MSKIKQIKTIRKSKHQKPIHYAVPRTYPKPLLAGVVVALVAAPTSWLMVHAQPVSKTGAGPSPETRQAGVEAAVGGFGNGKADTGSKPGGKDDDKKKDGSKAAASGGATASGTNPAPAAKRKPAPVPKAALTTWHSNVTTTIFWVGEAAGADNAGISNAQSAWDGNWQQHYGGYDDPDHRNGYHPAGFTPKENPFYFALPFNDLDENGDRKPTAKNCPNTGNSISWCKNAWIKIVKGGKVAYAQWQDVGPMQEDDVAYVFGTAQPKNTWGADAGLDVSPAVRDYLGLSDVDKVSWGFVSAASVPPGPWKSIITTSQGGW